MRQKRAKAYRKLMAVYERSFGFRQPYQVLVNADFCQTAVQLKMDLVRGMEHVLQGGIKPMITQCCIASLYALGKPGQSIVDLAKTFERRRCGHLETPLSPEECIATVVGPTNKHRYVVATQSDGLRSKLRNVPGVPTICLNRAVMIMEPASEKTKEKARVAAEESLHAPAPEMKSLEPALQAAQAETAQPLLPKKKKAKGPNPLSVKKKRPKPIAAPTTPKLPRIEQEPLELGKRKRDEIEADIEEGGGEGATEDGGKKRKRRKKTRKGHGGTDGASRDQAGSSSEE